MKFLAFFIVLPLCLCSSLDDDVKPLMRMLSDTYPHLTLKDGGVMQYANLTTPQLIEAMGYVAEVHHVVTEDGYILELHRIPYGINGSLPGPRPIAFLQHCIFCCSSDWIMDKPDRALAYLLADAGYDVWMNNVRGNTYSRNHTTLDPEESAFWQFTWDEHAVYDVPAAIDYALETTGNTQVYYVGFSMGTTTFFALMSEKNEYKDKIIAAALMGPVAYVGDIKGGMEKAANYSASLDYELSIRDHDEILPSGPKMHKFAQVFCPYNDTTMEVCYTLLFIMNGFDLEELNLDYLPVILSHTPAGSSIHNLNHFEQMSLNGLFQKYDWGLQGNLDHYGQDTPPLYSLGEDTPPIALYWGENDWLADPTDVAKLASELKNVVVNHRVEWPLWNHNDFIWGIHAKEFLYSYVIDFLSQY